MIRPNRIKESTSKISDSLQKALDTITVKDWYRAITCQSESRAEAMLKLIKDPTKKVGRALALFICGFKYVAIDKIDKDLRSLYKKDYLNRSDSEFVTYNTNVYKKNGVASRYPKTAEEEDALLGLQYPEYSADLFKDPDWAVNAIQDLTAEDIENLPSFKEFEEEYPDLAEGILKRVRRNFKSISKDEERYRKFYDEDRTSFEHQKARITQHRNVTSNFKDDDPVFEYVLDIPEEYKEGGKGSYLEYFTNAFAEEGMDYDKDYSHISPAPVADYLRYKTNFAEWLKKEGINVYAKESNPKGKMNMVYGQSQLLKEFEFTDDDSAFNALSLKKTDPRFQYLIKVTRNGIQLTDEGAAKYWYDCSKQVAEKLGIPFNCKKPF